jgi:nucleoside 2-deoxyribosyltransferase
MKRIIECPFCKSQNFVRMSVSSEFKYENVILEKCINIKCGRQFMVPLNYKTVYLARTFSVSETKYKYAINIKDKFSGVLKFIDVLDFGDNNDRLMNHPETIVLFDKQLIDKCDILVAFINQPTFGTLGEIYYALNKGILVYVINHNRIHIEDPWLKYIVNGLYTDIDKCYYDLINLSVKEYNMKYEKKK